ncbi:MAG: hypothetical protein JW982_13135 [Spirochaetes bacterium]|nr:hypothetical protein [Spirochaetota bacterium]
MEKKNPDEIKELCERLGLEKIRNADGLTKFINSYSGINRIFSTFNSSDLEIIEELTCNNGVTYTELNRRLKLSIEEIVDFSSKLDYYGIGYTLKNRKHLNNKLDKIALYPSIEELLKPIKNDSLTIEGLKFSKQSGFNKNLREFISFLNENGNIMTLDFINKHFPGDKIESLLMTAVSEKIIHIHHKLSSPFETIVSSVEFIEKAPVISNIAKKADNGYNILNNLFYTYDIISSHGLFYTQQEKFRKVDKRRIIDNIIPLFDSGGRILDEDNSLFIMLKIFDILKVMKEHRGSIHIEIDPEKLLNFDPFQMYRYIFLKSSDYGNNEKFNTTVIIPTISDLKLLKSVFSLSKSLSREDLINLIFHQKIKQDFSIFKSFEHNFYRIKESSIALADASIIFGLSKISNNMIELTEIGRKLMFSLPEKKSSKCIYINPNMTLLIPQNEIPPSDLFTLLNYIKVVKHDILIEAQITKQSILNAYKRKMGPAVFMTMLLNNSKNDIPQNFSFLIDEWIHQLNEVSIGYVTLLRSSSSAFLDNLMHHKKKVIIARINENFAVIDRNRIDEITSLADDDSTQISIDDELKF